MTIKRLIPLLFVLSLLVPVGASLLAQRAEQDAQAAIPTLQTHVIRVGQLETVVSTLGRIEANRTAALNFATTGKITLIAVKAGDPVQVGQVLAQVDDTQQRAALEQAEFALVQARLSLDELSASPTQNEIKVAEANVRAAQGAYAGLLQSASPEAIRAADAAIQAANVRATTLREARSVMGGEGTTNAELQLAEAQIGAATFDAELARQRKLGLSPSAVALSEAATAIEQAKLQLARVKAGPRPAQIVAAELDIRRAEARVLDAQSELDKTTLKSPINGNVVRINVQVGQSATSLLDRAAFDLQDTSTLWLTANIDELDVRNIQVGAAAQVRLDALSAELFDAKVETVALVSILNNGAVVYPTRFRLAKNDSRLRPGMTAEAFITLVSRTNVLVVPNEFVRLVGEQAFVNFVLPTGTTREVKVTLGLRSRDVSEVISGVREGDVIALPATSTQTGK